MEETKGGSLQTSKGRYDYLVKIKMVGDSATGKSSIVTRFVEDSFNPNTVPTIGVDYKSKIFDVYGKQVKATIWDTAGQERYRTITSNYYRGSHGIVFVYDVTSRESFNSVEQSWLKEAMEYFPENDVIMMLVGNKIDLDNRSVTKEEGEKMARNHGMMFIETSAKTRIGVQEAFEELVNKIVESPMIKEISLEEKRRNLANQEGRGGHSLSSGAGRDAKGGYSSYCCGQ